MSGCHNPNTDSCKCVFCLEKRIKDIEYRLNAIVKLPNELDIRLQDVERITDKLGDSFVKMKKEWEQKLDIDYKKWCEYFSEVYPQKKPHKCPVCDGSGIITTCRVVGGYSGIITSNSENKCNACEGKGIIWG